MEYIPTPAKTDNGSIILQRKRFDSTCKYHRGPFASRNSTAIQEVKTKRDFAVIAFENQRIISPRTPKTSNIGPIKSG